MTYIAQLFAPSTTGEATDVTVSVCRSTQTIWNALRQWHDLPAVPTGWRVAFAFYLNDSLIGVATWGRPVARLEEAEATLELTRHALAPGCPRNTATWTLGRMRKHIRAVMPTITRLISYCDMDRHHGTMYKADNWRCVAVKMRPEHTWSNRDRRVVGSERNHKSKWERTP